MTIDAIRESLHLIAGVLIWPVMSALLLLALATLVSAGGFLREAYDRRLRAQRSAFQATQRELDQVEHTAGTSSLELRLEEVLQRHEQRRWRDVRRARMAVRIGPALGLMGTLIPMATALQGLADGNLPALASNMVTAFAATVVGLTISVIAFVVTSIREDWVRADVQALAFHAEHVLDARARRGGQQAVVIQAGVAQAGVA
jgi:biopolymer transport protein ExbB/TolQ